MKTIRINGDDIVVKNLVYSYSNLYNMHGLETETPAVTFVSGDERAVSEIVEHDNREWTIEGWSIEREWRDPPGVHVHEISCRPAGSSVRDTRVRRVV